MPRPLANAHFPTLLEAQLTALALISERIPDTIYRAANLVMDADSRQRETTNNPDVQTLRRLAEQYAIYISNLQHDRAALINDILRQAGLTPRPHPSVHTPRQNPTQEILKQLQLAIDHLTTPPG